MKHIGIIVLAWLSITYQAGRDLYACKNVKVSIYSSAPIEDIKAASSDGTSVFNAASGEIEFSVSIRSFQFDKSRMQEHFNENYMESDKFPRATFKGKINEHVDVTKNGSYPVTATGTFEVHGVKQPRTISGKITVNNGALNITSQFMVKCADHQIEIPTIVFHHIAESIQVNISASYSLYK